MSKLLFSISEGRMFLERKLGKSIFLQSVFTDLKVRADELGASLTSSDEPGERNARRRKPDRSRRANPT
jgi:hypothetical protein